LNKQSALKIKRLLPVIPLALGFVAVAAAAHSTPTPQASTVHDGSSTTNPTVTPSPSSGPDVTVNGQKVDTNHKGTSIQPLPGGGQAKVEVSGDSTNISTNSSNAGSTANSSNGNLNVSVNSESNGGSGSSHTTVYGSTTNTTNNGSSHSFSSTNVFSTGPAHVEVKNP